MGTIEEIRRDEEVILEVLRRFPEGASLLEIQKLAQIKLDTRQLQRRMNRLINAGKVSRLGKTRKVKYHINRTEQIVPNDETIHKSPTIPLSDQGKKTLAQVNKPLSQRKPVTYNREFLTSYRPNEDFYLSEKERHALAKLSQNDLQPNQLAGTYAKQILQRLLIDLSWNSSRMEGNTYSLLETERLIEHGKAANNKSDLEAQMILNHKQAIEFVVNDAQEIDYNRYTIMNLHALLSENLLPDPAAAGRLRTISVGINHSVYIPLAIPQMIDEYFELMLNKARMIKDSFEQGFFIMVHLPYLQPFEDVNKRVSRLAVNIAFNKRNLSPLSFVDVPVDLYIKGLLGVYELNDIHLLKDVFLWAYDRSSARYLAIRQSMGEPDPFRLKYRQEIKEMVALIISNNYSNEEAITAIRGKAADISKGDQEKFIETVETELLTIHEGNFARYYIKPSEFNLWKQSRNR